MTTPDSPSNNTSSTGDYLPFAGVRIGSVFSGVEGMGLGVLAALGGRILWHAEVDPHASAVLARHFDAPNLGDVREVDWSQVEPVDLLIGGPPCQAVSQAGRRLGTADERWMWPEAFRAMAELRPPLVLWENPMGLLTGRPKDDEEDDGVDGGGLEPGDEGVGSASVDSGWFGHVLGEMASLGYVGRWGCVRSSDVGAPHGRARVFIAASDARSAGAGGDGRPLPRAAAGARRPGVGVRAAVDGGAAPAHAEALGHAGGGGGSAGVALLPTPQSREGGRWGMPSIATAVARIRSGRRNLEGAVALLPTPTTQPTTGNGHASDLGTETKHVDDRWVATLPDGRTLDYGPAVRRWETISGEPAPSPRDDKGRLNSELPRWMMGYPAGWLDSIPRTAALRCAGNGCQPQTARLAADLLLLAPASTEGLVA